MAGPLTVYLRLAHGNNGQENGFPVDEGIELGSRGPEPSSLEGLCKNLHHDWRDEEGGQARYEGSVVFVDLGDDQTAHRQRHGHTDETNQLDFGHANLSVEGV